MSSAVLEGVRYWYNPGAGSAGAFVAPGRPSLLLPSTDDFVPYVTEPDESNSGVVESLINGVYSGPTTITTPGTVIQNKEITQQLKIQAANVTIDNCLNTSVGNVTDQGMIDCRHINCVNFTVNRTTFFPNSYNFYTNSIMGHDWTMNRCVVENTVDGWSPLNTVGPGVVKNANSQVQFSMLKSLAWFYDDTPVHTDGTHNDGVQLHCGSFFRMHGNAIHGYKYNALGTPSLDGSENNRYPQIGQIFLVQHTAGYIPGYTSSERALSYDPVTYMPDLATWGGAPLIYKNWIWGGDNGIKSASKVSFTGSPNQNGAYVDLAMWVIGNTWMDYPRVYGSNPYPIRIDTNVWLNGQKWGVTTGQGWIDTTNPAFDFGNRYSNDLSIPSGRRGKSVGVRVDSATASVARAA